MSSNNIELGKSGEKIAVDFLKKKGYRIIEQNYRCLFGEIDIIAKLKKTLIFAEVKTRYPSCFGSPQEAVNSRKQEQIAKTALHYLASCQSFKSPARFDVLSILFNSNGSKEIEWFRDAFSLPEKYSY
ncbi:MAG: YraN family protein [Candidatus Omnitrophica bacterium]|nr:YraN family protein [Candidatus Omnitrophota bacterium]